MKTFEQIFTGMFNEVYKSPEGWPDNLSILKIHSSAAKEYTKQWLDELAKALNKNQGYGSIHPEYILEEIKKKIDKQ